LSTLEGGGLGTCACTDAVDEITRMAKNKKMFRHVLL
jgi:hypothetical protein